MKPQFFLLVLFTSLSNLCIAQNCIIADFPFNGNVMDVTNNGNNGSFLGAPALTTGHSGAGSTAYSFGAGDGININTTLGNFGVGDFSISLWLKYSSLPFAHARLFMKRDLCVASGASGPFYNLGVKNDGTVVLETNGVSYASQTSVGERVDDDRWHHLVLVRTGQDHKLYIDNGLSFTLVTPSVNNYINNAILQFGTDICVGVGSGVKYVGDLDNIKYYNCALGVSKIDSLYNHDFPLSLIEQFQSNFEIFPNPTSGQLQINTSNIGSGQYLVQLLNILGEHVYEQKVSDFPVLLDLNKSASKGVYFLKVSDLKKEQFFYRKIILK